MCFSLQSDASEEVITGVPMPSMMQKRSRNPTEESNCEGHTKRTKNNDENVDMKASSVSDEKSDDENATLVEIVAKNGVHNVNTLYFISAIHLCMIKC